jgi:predicted ATPase
LRNFKSIAGCDVQLGGLTFLVGPNGAGKSNFVDALRFVADALRNSLEHALRERGGIGEVRRRSGGHPTNFGIRLDLTLPQGGQADYAFVVGARAEGAFEVQREVCRIRTADGVASYDVSGGNVTASSVAAPPAASQDRLYLVNTSGLMPFRRLYDGLAGMGFYNPNPKDIRALQPPLDGRLLAASGNNIASVLAFLERNAPERKSRIEEFLHQVVPPVHGVERKALGPMETLEFRQDVSGAKHPWRFLAASMSDGTLRALAILTALYQVNGNGGVPLVALEEPETALHPAAAAVLRDALRDAAQTTQVLVTSHSPDLLDDRDIGEQQILAVVAEENITRLGPIDEGARSVLRRQLYTAGELLRIDQLRPEGGLFDERNLSLFD